MPVEAGLICMERAMLVIVLVMKELGRFRQSWGIERWFTELGPECRPKEWNAEESGSTIDSKMLIVFGSISLIFPQQGWEGWNEARIGRLRSRSSIAFAFGATLAARDLFHPTANKQSAQLDCLWPGWGYLLKVSGKH